MTIPKTPNQEYTMTVLSKITLRASLALVLLIVLGAMAIPDPTPSADASVVQDTTVITLKPVGEELKFDATEIRAKAGTTLKIVFENTSTIMPHSVVVLKRADDIETVGMAAMNAAEHDYIPPSEKDKMVAYTAMAAPGATVEVTFTVPPAGSYPYICTFPGHYTLMQGTLIATS